MSFIVEDAGLQTTLQAGPRIGLRHKGVPAGGAADLLSLALANRLVGNELDIPALEVTLSGVSLKFQSAKTIAITGAGTLARLNDRPLEEHTAHNVKVGDTLTLAPPSHGCRAYIAFAGGLEAESWLGVTSTYLPASCGGFKGRALQRGDEVSFSPSESNTALQTPLEFRPHMGHSWILRATPGPEICALEDPSQQDFFKAAYQVSQRASRMGAALEGTSMRLASDGRLPSSAVFPGTVQCPPSGQPFLLMAEAQTTGGYPRIAQVIRADRHMLGQLRPGDRVQFLMTTPETAAETLRQKTALLQSWLGDTFQLR